MSEADTGAGSGRSGGNTNTTTGGETGGPDAGRRAPHPGTEPYLVLIAEDEAPIAEAVAMTVQDAGYSAIVAAHGQQALDRAREHPPALVITDLMMPHLDGAELITALRARAASDGHEPPPIILMTAAGPRRAQAAGADAVLRKPFNIADLEALLRRFLGPPPASDTQAPPDEARVRASGAQGEAGSERAED